MRILIVDPFGDILFSGALPPETVFDDVLGDRRVVLLGEFHVTSRTYRLKQLKHRIYLEDNDTDMA